MTMPNGDAWDEAQAAYEAVNEMFTRNSGRRLRRVRGKPDYMDLPPEVRACVDVLGGLGAIYQGYGE